MRICNGKSTWKKKAARPLPASLKEEVNEKWSNAERKNCATLLFDMYEDVTDLIHGRTTRYHRSMSPSHLLGTTR